MNHAVKATERYYHLIDPLSPLSDDFLALLIVGIWRRRTLAAETCAEPEPQVVDIIILVGIVQSLDAEKPIQHLSYGGGNDHGEEACVLFDNVQNVRDGPVVHQQHGPRRTLVVELNTPDLRTKISRLNWKEGYSLHLLLCFIGIDGTNSVRSSEDSSERRGGIDDLNPEKDQITDTDTDQTPTLGWRGDSRSNGPKVHSQP